MKAEKIVRILYGIMIILLVILILGNRCDVCKMPNNLYALYCNFCTNRLYETDLQRLLAAILMKFAQYIPG